MYAPAMCGSVQEKYTNIHEKLLTLPDDVEVYLTLALLGGPPKREELWFVNSPSSRSKRRNC